MILGVMVTGVIIGLGSAASQSSGGASQFGGGFTIAFLISFIYVILGPIAGNKFKKANIVIETK